MVIQFVCFELKLDNPIKLAYSCVSLYILGLKTLMLVGVLNEITTRLYIVIRSQIMSLMLCDYSKYNCHCQLYG